MDDHRFRWALAAFGGLLAVTWWRPPFPAEQAMHHSLTVAGLVALVVVHRHRRLPFSSYALILVFLALHSVAARWIYSFVPYDDWTRALLGVPLSELAGWERNHFDRLVHLAYGLCFGPVVLGLLRGRWAPLIAVEIILSTSALYELFEWGIALTLAPADAEAYNGQQGDMWDAHKDMALATAGAVLSVLVTWWWRRRADLAPVCSDEAGSRPAG